jgi:hypothetical protein
MGRDCTTTFNDEDEDDDDDNDRSEEKEGRRAGKTNRAGIGGMEDASIQ